MTVRVIKKLKKDSFNPWKVHIEAILIKNRLWKYINGENTKPEKCTAVEIAT